jgi:hypothetical protein
VGWENHQCLPTFQQVWWRSEKPRGCWVNSVSRLALACWAVGSEPAGVNIQHREATPACLATDAAWQGRLL